MATLRKAKAGKALGLDNIPVEMLISEQSIDFISVLLIRRFTNSVCAQSLQQPFLGCLWTIHILLCHHIYIYNLYYSLLNNIITSCLENKAITWWTKWFSNLADKCLWYQNEVVFVVTETLFIIFPRWRDNNVSSFHLCIFRLFQQGIW